MKALKIVRNITIFAAVCAIVFLVILMFYERASDYTDAQHIQRVTDLAKKRYLNEDSEYTDLEVYPLYNADNKLVCFLIEFEPSGFVYVEIQEKVFATNSASMYIRDFYEGRAWIRRTVEMGTISIYADNFSNHIEMHNTRFTELDDHNNPILHYDSHFKTYNVQNERFYFLEYKYNYIPAVKRDNQYLNLISLEYMDYKNKSDNDRWVTTMCDFMKHSQFQL